jgi:hypothetical protein
VTVHNCYAFPAERRFCVFGFGVHGEVLTYRCITV